jgi:hypothetical protein
MKTRGRNSSTNSKGQQQEESTRGEAGGANSSSLSTGNRLPSITAATAAINQDETAHSDISLNLDTMGRERSSTLGSFRDRGLTLGSEFDDLGLSLGLDTAHATAAVAVAHPESIEFDSMGTAAAATAASSQRYRTTSTSSAMDYLGMLGQAASALAQHSEASAVALQSQRQPSSSLPSSKRTRTMVRA